MLSVPRTLCITAVILGSFAAAPAQRKSDSSASKMPGMISGVVLSDVNEKPLKRASVILRPRQPGNPIADVTGDDGRFHITRIPAGKYSVSVQCDGYVAATSGRIGATRMPPILEIDAGRSLGDFTFRLRPWAVVSGKITFEDSQPAMNVAVLLYREYRSRGRHGYTVEGQARTNDLGEFRVPGLSGGSYYIAALYQRALPPNAEMSPHLEASGKEAAEEGYTATFYPSVYKLGEAVAVAVGAAQELTGLDMVLRPVRTARIRGRIIGGLSGRAISHPAVTLEALAADGTAALAVPFDISYPNDTDFEVRGIAPGPYLLAAAGPDDGAALTAREVVFAAGNGSTDVMMVASAERQFPVTVRMDGADTSVIPGIQVRFEPRRIGAAVARAEASRSGDLKVSLFPNERYDVDVVNAADNIYIKSAKAANYDILLDGLEVQAGDPPAPIEIVLSTDGGTVSGPALTASGIPASGATVTLIPDPPRGRLQQYRTGYVMQNGSFQIRGVAPGSYVAVAWYDNPPCDFYDAAALDNCRAQGVPFTVGQGGGASLQLTLADAP